MNQLDESEITLVTSFILNIPIGFFLSFQTPAENEK